METTHTNEQPAAASGRFNTLQDILNDSVFVNTLREDIQKIKDIRNKPARPGYKWRKDGITTLMRESNFNVNYLVDQFPAIVLKQSTLSSSVRSAIEDIVSGAVRKTLKYYQTQK